MRVRYNGYNFDLSTNESMIITGMKLTFDKAERYNHNVTRRIEIMKQLCRKWSGRHLTINSRMLVFKTFILSQLPFALQSQVIRLNDVKYVEKLCYQFVWNNKPERVARSILKNTKAEGGISGLDTSAFVNSLQIRQYLKASAYSPNLKHLQNMVEGEEIAKSVRKCLHSLYVNSINRYDPSDYHHVHSLRSMEISVLAKPGSFTEKSLRNKFGLLRLKDINWRTTKHMAKKANKENSR